MRTVQLPARETLMTGEHTLQTFEDLDYSEMCHLEKNADVLEAVDQNEAETAVFRGMSDPCCVCTCEMRRYFCNLGSVQRKYEGNEMRFGDASFSHSTIQQSTITGLAFTGSAQ